ncbi:hypothetical protein KC19_4G117600 [Ceratodon purpureus]|uniref:DnaJ homologue subfamily C GRV2/DNAJC13 N-terminal domain-containing protein n=1 Tax=Ceratodon purpureus TaxID=3225 RepID=A0A8T0I9Q6_CERPU|nr:hypothetical protein KC19_4G117600 [Ceratodon purpureus]
MDYQVFLVRPPGSTRASRGGGLRLFRILDHGISILPLGTPNSAPTEYRFEHISKILAADDDPTELRLEILNTSKSGFGNETVRFCCEARTSLLTALLNRVDDVNSIGIDYAATKHSIQRGGLVDTILRVRSASIVKMVNFGHRSDYKVKASKKVNFQDIVKLEIISDDEQIVLVSLRSRTMRLAVKDSMAFVSAIQRNMKAYLKWDIDIEKVETSVMVDYFATHYKRVREYPVLYEFQAVKQSKLNDYDGPRTLSITKHLLIESSFDDIINIHSLEDLRGLVASEKNDQEVIIEFASWRDCSFLLRDREDFIASVADVMGMEKGSTFSVRLESFHSHTFPEQQNSLYQIECETFYLNRFMAAYNSTREAWALHAPLKEYAANIMVGESQCTDLKVLQAVAETLKECIGKSDPDTVRATTCCMVLVRLLGSKPCFDAIRSLSEIGTVLFQCVRSQNSILAYHATLVIRSAIKLVNQPGSTDAGIASKQEFANRLSVLSAENLQLLATLLHKHALSKHNSLQVTGILDILTYALSFPPTDNEAGRLWLRAYEASIMATGDLLCAFFRSTSDVVFTRLSILLQALLTTMSPVVCGHLQNVCVRRCVFLLHLSTAVFSKKPHLRFLSCSQIFLLMEGNLEAKNLLMNVLPKGVMNLYANKASEMDGKKEPTGDFPAWKDTMELLHSGSVETPLLVWNDIKRSELRKFLRDEIEGYYAALETNKDVWYNSADVQLVYSTASEGEGTVVRGIHLELLVDHQPPAHDLNNSFWKLNEPLPLFQSVYQAMLLGFTPLFGNNNLPEIDLRLAVHVLTWIYERHTDDVTFCMETLKVIETVVGMLREVIDSEHEVFVFKLVIFLLATLEKGKRENVVRFTHAGGAAVLASLMVISAEKGCKNKMEFECNGWTSKDALTEGVFEMVNHVGSDGVSRLVRIPSGIAREMMGKSVQDGSLEAKDGIRWQDKKVPPKIQLGLVLDQLETLLRVSGDSSSKQHYPPSAAVLSLSKEETLYHLVQVLLRLKSPEFGRVLEILLIIVKSNRSAMRRLYSLGAFEILLWKLLAGDLVVWEKEMLCKFLLQCHLKQDHGTMLKIAEDDQSICKSSALRLYLPDGLVLRLMAEDTNSNVLFASILDSQQDTPDVIWNLDMRQRLLDHLTSELEPYVKSRANDPMAPYVHTPRAPIYYPELTDIVFSAPYYLQNILDMDRFPDYPISDPDGFLRSLMLNLRNLAKAGESTWRKEPHRIQLLIRALAYLVVRHKLTLPSDTEYLLVTMSSPSLQTCLVENESSPQVCIDTLQSAVEVLRKVVAASTKAEDLPLTSLNFSLDILSLGSQWSANNNLDSAIAGSLSVLELISSNQVGRKHLWEDLRWQKGMKWALSSAVSAAMAYPPRDPSPVSYAALSSLKHFAGDSNYSRRFIDEGFHLLLLLLLIPSPNADLKSEFAAKSTLPILAADVIGSFVRAEGIQSGSLTNIIPRSLLSCLENDEDLGKFISMAGSDIRNPTTVWTGDMRAEFRKRALDQTMRQKDLAIEDEVQWLQKYEYACLQTEFVIGGVFVNHLASGKWEAADLPNDPVFMDLMMEYLEGEQNVVSATEVEIEMEGYEDKHVIFSEGVQEQRGQAAELEKYVLVLSALKECLTYAASHGRNDLIKGLKLQTFLEVASIEHCAPKVWTEIMLIFKAVAQDETSQIVILQSNLLGLAGIYLWDAVTEDKGEETEAALVATLDMLHSLSENIKAAVEMTNYFSSSGVLFPLLCIFCNVDLPSLRTGIMETERITPHQRLMAACLLGQLLLCLSGVTSRVSFLGDNSTVLNDLFSESKIHRVTTDIDELMNLLEPGYSGTEPLVFRTLISLLPLELLSTLAHNPSQACEMYNETVYLPRLVWDDESRRSVKQLLTEEAIKLQGFVKNQLVAGLGSWSIELEQPVFTRWVLATVLQGDKRPVYRNIKEDAQYVPELYLGGFFLDQFLRIPEFFFGKALEQRFLREVKKAIVLGTYADDLDSLRRLILSLLLLFKGRPYLLAGRSYIDIFLAVSRNICSTGTEARMLAQPVVILTHSIANHKDIVDIIVSEDLIHSLVDFLDLNVPKADAGFAGTDPRMCSLMLLLRLIRLSPRTVELTSTVSVVQKLADTVLDMEGNNEVSKTALECLALMCNDKRRGKEVIRLLDSFAPADTKGFWDIPVENIWDDAADFEILQHFLQHRYPCAWWTTDKSNELLDNGVPAAPLTSTNLNGSKAGAYEDKEIFSSTESGKWDAQFSQDHFS